MEVSSRHSGRRLWEALDLVSCLLCLPCYYCANYGLACYYLTTGEQQARGPGARARDLLVVGPLLLALALLSLPLALHGWLLWLLVCQLSPCLSYSLLTLGSPAPPTGQKVFTVVTSNALLGPEMVSKFNNLGSSLTRLEGMAARILEQGADSLHNVREGRVEGVARELAVLPSFPRVDFLCFQEVFDRLTALRLARALAGEFPYWVVDVGTHGLATNLCLLGSGLVVASRFPITRAAFTPWRDKRAWHWGLSQGLLLCRLELGQGRLGILGNLHTVAYQGKQPLVRGALDQVQEALDTFRKEQVGEGERLEWEVVAGDWNVDNQSPGDRECAEHEVFRQLRDPGVAEVGREQGWAVGTELRQATLHMPEMRHPDSFRDILVDDVRRRHYVNDGDVTEHTFELMTSKPAPNSRGEVVAEPWGGMRKIDRVLYRPGGVVLRGVATVTALAGLTDHAPVLLAIEAVDRKE